jgi:hypothetical protein
MSIGINSKQKAFSRSSSDQVVFVLSQFVILERSIGTDLRWGVIGQSRRLDNVPTNATLLSEKGWDPWRAGRCTLQAYVR